MTPVEMYKLFFGPQVVCPDSTEDAGLSCNHPDTQVSSPVPGHTIHSFITTSPLKELSLKQEWVAKAKLIRCPAPLPETLLDPVLTRMLEIAPSEESEGGGGQRGCCIPKGGCLERRNRKFLYSGEEEDCL